MSTTQNIRRFMADETAATTIEYGLVASLVAAAIIPVVSGLGVRVSSTFSKLASAMQDAPPVAESAPYAASKTAPTG